MRLISEIEQNFVAGAGMLASDSFDSYASPFADANSGGGGGGVKAGIKGAAAGWVLEQALGKISDLVDRAVKAIQPPPEEAIPNPGGSRIYGGSPAQGNGI